MMNQNILDLLKFTVNIINFVSIYKYKLPIIFIRVR